METVKIIKFDASKCDECRSCERACSNLHFKHEKGGQWSAIRIIKKNGSPEMSNCNHCGLCIDMCPVLALKRSPRGTVLLNRKICVGCQSCVAFCPKQVMRRAEGDLVPFKCISCGACVRACPKGALSLEEVRIADVSEEVYAKWGSCE